MITEDVVQLSALFLSVSDSNLIGPSSEVNLKIKMTSGDFSPLSGFSSPPSLSPFPDTLNGEKVYAAGVNGVGIPSCYFMPTPNYTETAREAGFSRIVTAEGVVGSDGLVRAVRIVNGAPFGIDEAVIKTIGTWKYKPAAIVDEEPGFKDEVLTGTESADQPAEEMSERRDHSRNHIGKARIELCAKSFILQVYDVLAKQSPRHASSVRR